MLVDIPMWMGKFHKAPQIVEELQPISGYRKLSEETGISTFGHILMLYFNTHKHNFSVLSVSNCVPLACLRLTMLFRLEMNA